MFRQEIKDPKRIPGEKQFLTDIVRGQRVLVSLGIRRDQAECLATRPTQVCDTNKLLDGVHCRDTVG